MNAFDVTIMIPTFRRPEGLRAVLDSLTRLTGLDGVRIETLVVDNAPEGGAQAVVDAIRPGFPFELILLHEPNPGVANARNTGWAAARGRFVAFIDDDETAEPDWLTKLLETQAQFDAAVVFGPVEAVLPSPKGAHEPYLQRFFSRIGPESRQTLDRFYGCGNSLLLHARMGERPFDDFGNEHGGEDDLLFQRLTREGAIFAWAPDALVYEHVPEHRANLKYALTRSFGHGQGPPTLCAKKPLPDVVGVARWMVVGVAQSALYGVLSLVGVLSRAPNRAHWFDRTAQGLGKVFWFPPFSTKFYGAAIS